MNVLKLEKQAQIVSMMVEGTSIRSVERITGVHRDTIMRLMVRVGRQCQAITDEVVQGVQCQYAQCDEIWCYVGKKQRRITFNDSPDFGDTYTFVAFDQDSKLAISYLVGKRDGAHTHAFMDDFASRTIGQVQISTDAWGPYPDAVMSSFNGRSRYGQIVKSYHGGTTDVQSRYSPPSIVNVRKIGLWGFPRMRYVSTSHVERNNLTMRMQMRRFTRLTNAFSKKLPNLKAAVALHFAWYNFVRPHRGLGGITPAMAAGIVNSFWTIEDLMMGGQR